MHPATPLIPAIWSSSKHAGDVKIPHLDTAHNRPPESKWIGWGERGRVENGGVWQGVLKEEEEEAAAQGGGWGWAVACVIHTSRRHRYWLISLTISCDHRYIKHERGDWMPVHLIIPAAFSTPHSLLWGNVNSSSNLFTSPLVATALCFWWRAAKKSVPFPPLLFLSWQECGY